MSNNTWKVVLQSDSPILHGTAVADGFKSEADADQYAATRSGKDAWRYVAKGYYLGIYCEAA